MRLLLVLLWAWAAAERVAIVMDARTNFVEDTKRMQDALLRGFEQHLYKAHMNVTVYCGANWVLTWTEDKRLVELAIREMHFHQVDSAGNWAAALEAVSKHTPDAQRVVLITTDEPHNVASAVEASHALQGQHTKVYPIGVGERVSKDALKKIAGPCNKVFGCLLTWNYYLLTSYRSINTVLGKDVLEGNALEPPARMAPEIATPTTSAPVPVQQYADVVGHVYLAPKALKTKSTRGYAGVRFTLRDSLNQEHVRVSSPGGDVNFERIPTGVAHVDILIPPGMVAKHTERSTTVDIVAHGLNRLPPVELDFSDVHYDQSKVVIVPKTAKPLSGGDIAIIVVGSVLGGVFLVALIWWWCRTPPRDYAVLSSINSTPAPRQIVRISEAPSTTRALHGLKQH